MAQIGLRAVRDDDLDEIFDQRRDPVSVWMAAFTAEDPDDRAAFDAHIARLRNDPEILLLAVTVDGALAGTVGSFPVGADTEITYWLARAFWGAGVATRAVELLLDLVPVRPITARAASDNAGSLGVLRKAGFRPVGKEVAYATARRREIEETVLRLDGL
ncbi:GNAT family N-acetyltransferase [Amorphoplanes nipponensis]|uniref:N-acetyltransferase n=1 Tax=Actinoplanes nipponensis TaxID=135950 RepID=A0A919MLQ9_9ACTN|nr:GNAT family N-acetyltransferase [Actinoplanes nipponensis]GIE54214.1 N-acetyltransferase [Actinoplanes nipponensis]